VLQCNSDRSNWNNGRGVDRIEFGSQAKKMSVLKSLYDGNDGRGVRRTPSAVLAYPLSRSISHLP